MIGGWCDDMHFFFGAFAQLFGVWMGDYIDGFRGRQVRRISLFLWDDSGSTG